MKFSKHQKETIKYIFSGEIYDISSYLKHFNLGHTVRFEKDEIIKQFNVDNIPKTFYCPKNLQQRQINALTEDEFNEKVRARQITPENYSLKTLQLSYHCGIKHENWENVDYTMDFYSGVYIANSFNVILEFLTLWQYLRSEMLILEVPNHFCAEALGLFYEPAPNIDVETLSLSKRIKNIDFDHFTYDDQYYLFDKQYSLSYEHCTMCKEYIDKRIYPSSKLGIFIKKGFKTSEERTQNSALFVAWLAIFVSIILTFAPYFHQGDTSDMQSIVQDVQYIRTSMETSNPNYELASKLENLINKLDVLIETLSSNENTTPESTVSSEH